MKTTDRPQFATFREVEIFAINYSHYLDGDLYTGIDIIDDFIDATAASRHEQASEFCRNHGRYFGDIIYKYLTHVEDPEPLEVPF